MLQTILSLTAKQNKLERLSRTSFFKEVADSDKHSSLLRSRMYSTVKGFVLQAERALGSLWYKVTDEYEDINAPVFCHLKICW